MTVAERIAALDPENRAIVLAALDEISRPMTLREIERAWAMTGRTTRSQRRALLPVLSGVDVIALERSAA